MSSRFAQAVSQLRIPVGVKPLLQVHPRNRGAIRTQRTSVEDLRLDHPCGLIGAGQSLVRIPPRNDEYTAPEVMRALKNGFDCRDSDRNHGGRGRHGGIPDGSIRWSWEFGYDRSASHARQR